MKKTIVIGAGVAGLSAAAHLARDGFDVTVLEKHATAGGRARRFQSNGFSFDMGPSWYWMPDVIESFFNGFGKKVSDYYSLARLDPSYRVYFGQGDFLDVPAGLPALQELFERMEPGSGRALTAFLTEGRHKYELGMGALVYKSGLTWRELLDRRVVTGLFRLHIFHSFSGYVRKFFRNPRLISLLEFPVLFLGAAPSRTPALYSLMNYADMMLGTWYPQGGMYNLIEAMVSLCSSQDVRFVYNAPVTGIEITNNIARGVRSHEELYRADYVVAGADYHHVEKDLLPGAARQYTDAYWDSRIMAPSCVIFYVGLNKRVKGLLHHTLFFDQDMESHLGDIYQKRRWPTSPQFYVSCTSRTDPGTAPPGCENLFILIPVAPGLDDDDAVRERYFAMVIARIEQLTGESIRQHIVFQKSYAHRDFTSDYNAFRGNAYGLANTLLQTANFRPRIRNRKVRNLFYAGQLTVPGPGLPPSLISGKIVAAAVKASVPAA